VGVHLLHCRCHHYSIPRRREHGPLFLVILCQRRLIKVVRSFDNSSRAYPQRS
jgi:hypothetical protein